MVFYLLSQKAGNRLAGGMGSALADYLLSNGNCTTMIGNNTMPIAMLTLPRFIFVSSKILKFLQTHRLIL
jgi:hypothetical protein